MGWCLTQADTRVKGNSEVNESKAKVARQVQLAHLLWQCTIMPQVCQPWMDHIFAMIIHTPHATDTPCEHQALAQHHSTESGKHAQGAQDCAVGVFGHQFQLPPQLEHHAVPGGVHGA
jgi:hypothetical protein